MEPLICEWDPAFLYIFSDNVFSPLIYYSHFGPMIVSLLIGFLVLYNNPRALVNKVLFALTAFFSIWVLFDLILWGSEQPDVIMFSWSILTHVELLIYAAGLYLVALFANQGKDVSIGGKLAVGLFFVPVIFLTHTAYNLLGFDFTNCDREAIEGPLWQYIYVIELFFIGWAIILASRGYRKIKVDKERRQLLFMSLGTILMLLLFNFGNLIVTYFLEVDWSYEQYKLFGMPILSRSSPIDRKNSGRSAVNLSRHKRSCSHSQSLFFTSFSADHIQHQNYCRHHIRVRLCARLFADSKRQTRNRTA